MSLLKDFKDFAVKGNVIDLAVAVIIGGAFGKIVSALVADLIMPVVGLVVGKIDFTNLFVVLGDLPAGTPRTLEALKKANIPVLAYGDFLTITLNFLILAFVIFLMVRMIAKLKRAQPEEAPPPAPTPEDVLLLREIRDSLKR
ncbi:MAG: large conductance mechanosensitive channel protein MscL [Betaproteobacteria bacterium]|jgi:large conductance mechanosensitive channel|nr:large conductance mechanosensitive channel protein MscL [Betaproteobacteria bacterium]MBU6512255.1 large conductance mechanosensitive channel protein MscL [Betaproteobacteria bacterium]MDE1955801.1 large conductance mechanosensitive channel protein MscL [Betaproteobacteria bacterium]MDE2152457.1 large conductance mechanosensitive channel protein MscL [Betaproteobacteria bacterium]MDE2477520.1 large conductance mechanosensitive channel protein MscL [Betaproteobacteria bacterium]